MVNPEASSETGTTPVLHIPLLTEAQKQALVEADNYGITPVTGIIRYPTFDDWMAIGFMGGRGIYGRNNFHARFSNDFIGKCQRESQHFQRYAFLYPEQLQQLIGISEELFSDPSTLGRPVDEATERAYWEAYETLADLVDANDDPKILHNGKDLPYGEAIPSLLTA